MQPDREPKLSESHPDAQRSGSASEMSSGSAFVRGGAYTAPPSAQPSEQSSSGDTRGHSIGLALIVAAAIGLVAFYGFATWKGPPPTQTVAAAVDRETKSFLLASADIDAEATEQLKTQLAGGAAELNINAANAPALAALAQTSPEVADDIRAGRRNVYRVTLLDFLAQDGDRVDFFADGVSHGNIDLKNGGKTLLIPLVPGKPTTFKILATTDGGGGVTVGFVSSLGEARTNILQVGQSESWQVIVK